MKAVGLIVQNTARSVILAPVMYISSRVAGGLSSGLTGPEALVGSLMLAGTIALEEQQKLTHKQAELMLLLGVPALTFGLTGQLKLVQVAALGVIASVTQVLPLLGNRKKVGFVEEPTETASSDKSGFVSGLLKAAAKAKSPRSSGDLSIS